MKHLLFFLSFVIIFSCASEDSTEVHTSQTIKENTLSPKAKAYQDSLRVDSLNKIELVKIKETKDELSVLRVQDSLAIEAEETRKRRERRKKRKERRRLEELAIEKAEAEANGKFQTMPSKIVKKEAPKVIETVQQPIKEPVKVAKKYFGDPEIYFNKKTHNFGKMVQGEVTHVKFNVTNTGSAPLEILNATASCGCTYPSFPFLPIDPNKSGVINVTFDSKDKWGDVNPEIKVFTNIKTEPFVLYLKGYVDDSKEAIEKKAQLDKKTKDEK